MVQKSITLYILFVFWYLYEKKHCSERTSKKSDSKSKNNKKDWKQENQDQKIETEPITDRTGKKRKQKKETQIEAEPISKLNKKEIKKRKWKKIECLADLLLEVDVRRASALEVIDPIWIHIGFGLGLVAVNENY